ncbi:Uncharacterized protein with LysM domain, COG1652 [hydrothermal vent metagenome]|uniref:Uncharacterized protein with LysM domain, COG1652 n=1 Tax=hydrothermal vent metagenome TaxID=652676 RepID=A0A3B0ZGP4_9ZZZZ
MIQNKVCRVSLSGILLLLGMWGLVGCSSTQKAEPKPAPVPAEQAAPVEDEVTTTPMQAEADTQVSAITRDYPDRYVVKKGDTLWDIAAKFLKSPWLWPEVWNINPKIRNPHLIYPGDVVVLHYVDGQPFLTLEGAGGVLPPPKGIDTVKLSPRVHAEPLEKAITTIPRSAIDAFLYAHRIIGERELEYAPYIVSSFEQHLISGPGHKIYARRLENPKTTGFQVVRPGATYRHPVTNEILGYEAINLGESNLIKIGKPSTLRINRAFLEILDGDYLLPLNKERKTINFLPKAPNKKVKGYIISVINGVTDVGQNNVVALSLGSREGMEEGDVLDIYQGGVTVRDRKVNEKVKLPDEKAGILMVFRVFDKVSYALVLEATRVLHVLDVVQNPE